MPAQTGRESDKFMLRLPEGMRDRIREAAEAAGRSMNTEIVARLEASFNFDRSDADFRRMAKEIYDRQVDLDRRLSAVEGKK